MNYCGTGPDSPGMGAHAATSVPPMGSNEPPFNPFPAIVVPVEPAPGRVIGFAKRFIEGGETYYYAAICTGPNMWYLSGPRKGGAAMHWSELLEFIGGPEEWAGVGVASTWSPLA